MQEGVKPLVYSGIILFVIAIAAFYFLFISSSGTLIKTSPGTIGEICNTLENNGGATSIVFFAEKEVAERYTESLFEFSPLKENRKSFNMYYIDALVPKCEFYDGIALFCHSRDLIRVASTCPSDYIVVIKDEEPRIRSSSYGNVMSLNSAYTERVFAHEFGHAFSNFAEEYVPGLIPRGAKNCVPNEEEFEGETDGRFDGCSRADHDRSIKDGIMRTLDSHEYGTLNEILLSKEITPNTGSITGNAIEDERNCGSEQYILVDIMRDGEELSVLSKTREIGCIGGNGFGESEYKIFDESGNLIASDKFSSNLIFTDAPPVSNGEIGFGEIVGETYVSREPYSIRIPIVEEAKEVEISSGEQSITVSNVGSIDFSSSSVGFIKATPIDRILGDNSMKFSFGGVAESGDFSINFNGEISGSNSAGSFGTTRNEVDTFETS